MNEWGVVGVIVVLVGLIISIATPLVKNTKAMTELTVTMRNLADKLTSLEGNNTEAHRRIWAHNEEQDGKIQDHEIRIVKLEEAKKNEINQ